MSEDQSMLTTSLVALAAHHESAQEVAVDTVALASLEAGIHHLLYSFEQFGADDGRMAPGVHRFFERDHSEVVRVSKDQAQLASGQRTFWPLGRLSGRQALVGEGVGESDGAVFARRVLLECPLDERCSDRIHVDGVDESAVEVFADVEVAEFGAADGAAVLGFVQQLVLDVLAALADLDFVHDVGDGFHGVCHVSVAELFLGGDELDAHPGEDAFGDGGVGLVAEDARAHVDDDVAHFRVFLDVAEEFAEDGAFGD
nr:hypothetical protein [uncultured Microbacterium sp.]